MGYQVVKPSDIRETVVTADLDSLGIYSFDEIKEMDSIPEDRDSSPLEKKSMVVDFSTPPEDLVDLVEHVLETKDSGSIKAGQLASASIDAVRNWNETVSADYVLASQVYDEVFYPEEGVAAITDIPSYFYDPAEPEEFLFMGSGDDARIGIFSQDETAVAWQVGRTLSEYDLPEGFRQVYNETMGHYDLQRKSERS